MGEEKDGSWNRGAILLLTLCSNLNLRKVKCDVGGRTEVMCRQKHFKKWKRRAALINS